MVSMMLEREISLEWARKCELRGDSIYIWQRQGSWVL